MSEVAPRLLVGNRRFAADRGLLRTNNVVAVVCVGAKPQFSGDSTLVYHHVSIPDTGGEPMSPHFAAAGEFISSQLARGEGAVLVHCQGGMSRSPCMAMAYLIQHKGLTLSEAAEMISLARPAVRPRPTFILELETLATSREPNTETKEEAADADTNAAGAGEKREVDEDEDEEKEAAEAGATRPISRGLGDVVGTANGHIHALVWNRDGELWAFGCGSGGRAGVAYYVIGANPDHPRKSRMKAYMSTPNRVGACWPQTAATRRALESMGLVPALEGKRVLSAATSRYHGVCLVEGANSVDSC